MQSKITVCEQAYIRLEIVINMFSFRILASGEGLYLNKDSVNWTYFQSARLEMSFNRSPHILHWKEESKS
jgi:hypothetical protein